MVIFVLSALGVIGVMWLALSASVSVSKPPEKYASKSLNDHVNDALEAVRTGLVWVVGHHPQHVRFAGTRGGHPLLVCDMGDCYVSWCAGVVRLCEYDGTELSDVKVKDEHTFFLAKVDAGLIA